MTLKTRTVTVRHLPHNIDRHSERTFLRELAMALQSERPSIVLDCAPIREMDAPAIHLLLCCLEQAMKRNGDVRLAGLSSQGMELLQAWGVDRLFRTFDSVDEAVESYRHKTAFVPVSPAASSAALASEHAA